MALTEMSGDPSLRPARAAEYIGVSIATLYRLVQAGELPRPFKIGKRAVAWSRSQLDEFNARRRAA